MRTFLLPALVWIGLAAIAFGQEPYGDIGDLRLAKPEDKVDVKPMPPPDGAIVLFDGKSLDAWEMRGSGPAAWILINGAMQTVKGDLVTKQKFGGAFILHVEFRVPYMPKAKGQARGNSGVYVQGRYEVQILDSYGLASKNNDCGAIYEVAAPLVNACKAPTVWQSYDITFRPPECADGKKTAPARMSVYHNGVKIHDDLKIPKDNTRAGAGGDVCTPGPILLQFHGNAVQYRNIWLVQQKAEK